MLQVLKIKHSHVNTVLPNDMGMKDTLVRADNALFTALSWILFRSPTVSPCCDKQDEKDRIIHKMDQLKATWVQSIL